MSTGAGLPEPELTWARDDLTARLNTIMPALSGRGDVLLQVEWDLPESAAPGWYDDGPAVVSINGDATLRGVHPDDVDPTSRAGRLRHPVLIGVTAHEGAHARVTQWRAGVPAGVPALVLRVAALLEEPRAEGRQVTYRPGDRLYLRAAVLHLIQIPPAGDAPDPDQDRWRAAAAFTLLCGRAIAGVLEEADVRPVRAAAEAALGSEVLAELDGLVREAVALPDGDGAALVDVARRWLHVTGLPETGTDGALGAAGCASPRTAATGDDSGSGTDLLGEATADTAAAIAAAAAAAAETAADAAAALPERDRSVLDAREAEDAITAEAAAAAAAVFTGPHARGRSRPGSPVTGTRPPTGAERAAANRLAAALRRARYRGPEITRIASPAPPGRLIGRDALAAHAQRELGLPVTARPFRSRVRRHVEQPRLRVGIAADVSGSMGWAAGPVASAAWILATGAARVQGQVAAVAFGSRVTPLAVPGFPPAEVPVLDASDGEEAFTSAVRALDGALQLSAGAGARLLFIVSDGELVIPGEEPAGRALITRLVRAGTGVLWLDPDGRARVMPGAVRVPLAAAADAAAVIGRAVEEALAAAAR